MSRDPVFYVRVAGAGGALGSRLELTDRVLSLRYEDDEGAADKLVLSLDNQDLALFDEPQLGSGALLEVAWGYAGDTTPPRIVVVTNSKGHGHHKGHGDGSKVHLRDPQFTATASTLNVVAHAQSVLMNSRTRTRSFHDAKRSDVVRRVAQEHGYGPERQDVEDTRVVQGTVTQARMTDAQFLRKLADAEGYQFYVDAGVLHFHRRRVGQAPALTLTWRASPVGEVLDFSVESDVGGRPGATVVRGRDPLERRDFEARSSNGTEPDRDTLAPELELVSPEDGSSAMAARGSPERVRRIGSEEVLPTAARDAATAKAEARGRFEVAQQATVKLRLEVVGSPIYAAKTVVRVQGLGKRLSGNYYVTKVEHVLDSGGYRCTLEMRSDGHGGYSGAGGVDSAGRVNEKPGPAVAQGEEGAPLEAVDLVSQETGEARTVYRDARQGGKP